MRDHLRIEENTKKNQLVRNTILSLKNNYFNEAITCTFATTISAFPNYGFFKDVGRCFMNNLDVSWIHQIEVYDWFRSAMIYMHAFIRVYNHDIGCE